MKIVVSDSSVLMNLAKTELIEPTLALPFECMVPDVMLAKELRDLGRYASPDLERRGFKVGSLEGAEALRAMAYCEPLPRHCHVNFAWTAWSRG